MSQARSLHRSYLTAGNGCPWQGLTWHAFYGAINGVVRSEQVAHVLPRSREVPGLGRREAAMHKAAEAHHIGLVEGHPELALAAELPAGDTSDVYQVVQRDL